MKWVLVLLALVFSACIPRFVLVPTNNLFSATVGNTPLPIEGGLFVYKTEKYELRVGVEDAVLQEGQTAGDGAESIEYSLKNLQTNQAIQVIYDESAITLVSGNSSRVSSAGVRYIEMDRSIPNTIVPPGGSVSNIFFPINNRSFVDREWKITPLFKLPIKDPIRIGLFVTLGVGTAKETVNVVFTSK